MFMFLFVLTEHSDVDYCASDNHYNPCNDISPTQECLLASECLTWSIIIGSITNIHMKNSMAVKLLNRLGHKEQRK